MDLEEFTEEVLKKSSVNLDKKAIAGVYEDAVNLLDEFAEAFSNNPTIVFQVERFAGIKSVEDFMIDKFATKQLMINKEEFAKRKRLASSMSKKELGESKNDAIVDSDEKEKILTENYLQSKMRQKVKIGSETDVRKSLEQQFMRKPTKILEVNFEAILPDLEKPGETIRIPIDTGITILEMINTLRDLSEVRRSEIMDQF